MDKNDKLKIIIISLLSVILIVLFYFYFSANEKPSSNNSDQSIPVQNSNDKIIKDIDSIFFTFGIKKEWIRDISGKDSKSKTTQSVLKEVLIPTDLPVIELNYEVSNYLQAFGFNNKVIEEPKSRNINMEIRKPSVPEKDSSMQSIGSLKFIYTDSIKRNASVVCIIVDSIDSYSLDDAEKILNSNLEYSVFVPLRNDKADYQSKITELKKDYLIKFSIGDENDI